MQPYCIDQMNNLTMITILLMSALGVCIIDAVEKFNNKKNILPKWNDDECLRSPVNQSPTVMRRIPSSINIDV